MNKSYYFIAFIIIAIIQIYIPASMMMGREDIVISGQAYKFKTAPIDPNDPFRGKYIYLQFDATEFIDTINQDWNYDKTIYVHLGSDDDGFVKIVAVSKERPENQIDYIKAKVSYYQMTDHKIIIDYPFDRYYMEETIAYDAELLYNENQANDGLPAYAVVYVKNGEAVLDDVMIEGEPISVLVRRRQQELLEN